jgi:hypothetical protein
MGYSLLAEIWFLKLSIARGMEILPCKTSRTTCRAECERALVLMDLFQLHFVSYVVVFFNGFAEMNIMLYILILLLKHY